MMIDALSQFARKKPSSTLLICGILISFLPVGLGINLKLLDEYDLIPDPIRHFLWMFGILQAVVSLAGFLLIGLSAVVSVRHLAHEK